jgi:hypothetical protein
MKESLWVMNCEEHRKKEQRYIWISNPVFIVKRRENTSHGCQFSGQESNLEENTFASETEISLAETTKTVN